jgi:hypothetical protein
MSTIAKVNKMLQKAGRVERLIRDRSGYYYVSDVAVYSSLCCYRLDDKDLLTAIEHVEDVLTREDGKEFRFPIRA